MSWMRSIEFNFQKATSDIKDVALMLKNEGIIFFRMFRLASSDSIESGIYTEHTMCLFEDRKNRTKER